MSKKKRKEKKGEKKETLDRESWQKLKEKFQRKQKVMETNIRDNLFLLNFVKAMTDTEGCARTTNNVGTYRCN